MSAYFERLTEGARRVVFFARYEASVMPSGYLELEHLLLGLLREDNVLKRSLTPEGIEEIYVQVKAKFPVAEPMPTSVDISLTEDAQRALGYAGEEAVAMEREHVEMNHLVLGIVRVGNPFVAELLGQYGIKYESLRQSVSRSCEVLDPGAPLLVPELGDLPPIQCVERNPASPSLGAHISRLRILMDRTTGYQGYWSLDSEQRLKRKSWSRKEAMGHLVDWATAHHLWFIRALTEPRIVVGGYPTEEWVTVQNYRAFPWVALVQLWIGLNQLIVHVLVQVPETKVTAMCRVGTADPVPLSRLVEQYVEHCEDILGQIAARLKERS